MSAVALLALLVACDGPPGQRHPPQAPLPTAEQAIAADPATAGGFDRQDPASCAPCHATIVDEWRTSMHARAATDPIYTAMVQLRAKRAGPELANRCANCHSPDSPQDLTTDAAQVGVSCVTCHTAITVDHADGRAGAQALSPHPEGAMLGPHDIEQGASPVHPTGPAPAHMQAGDNSLCLACHDQRTNPAGVPTCTTGPENAQLSEVSCRSCHMPRVSGPAGAMGGRVDHASHAFLGPRQTYEGVPSTLLQQSLGLHGDIHGETLELRLSNLSGHALPTGFPGRVMVIKAIAKDQAGAIVWQNWRHDIIKESPESLLGRAYGDDQGQPIMPPFATQQLADTRLQPSETRVLHFTIPPKAATVHVTASYRLAAATALDKLGLKGSPLAQPHTISTLTVTR